MRRPLSIVAIVLGGVLVFFMFPRKDREQQLLSEYHATDTTGDLG